MNTQDLRTKWSSCGPQLLSTLRIVAAAMFMLAGTMKIFAFPAGIPPNGGTAVFGTEVWVGGILEVACGALLLVGFFTRPAAFLMSGQMAVAYFQFHFPQSFWPTLNGGMAAALYCFVWLYLSAAGPGPWSLDAKLRK